LELQTFEEFQFVYRHYAFVMFCSGKLRISISSCEIIFSLQADVKRRGPVLEQDHILCLYLCVEYLDDLHYSTVWPNAHMQFLLNDCWPIVVHDRGGPTTVEGRAYTYNFELSTTTPMSSRSVAAFGI
jgi:hypothetical protein